MKLIAAKCPSCGANIEVDRSLKITKCDYCHTEIMVEEAIENLLKVELKDTPTFENYLKLGNRYFDNQEFEEAYKAFSKAEEIEPDNPYVVLRRGLCRTLISEYNSLDVRSAVNGMKNAYELMTKMKLSREEINQCINDTGATLYATKKYVVDVYNRNKLNKEQTKGYIERLEACLDGYYYLDQIVEGDSALEGRIVSSIVEIIDIILGNANTAKYQLSSSYVTELKQTRQKYANRLGNNLQTAPKFAPKEKVVGVEQKTSIIWDILCYIMIFFLFILFLGSIFNKESLIIIFLWFLSMISFLPFLKKKLMKQYGSNMGIVVIVVRIVLVFTTLILFSMSPPIFAGEYHGKEGEVLTIQDGKLSIVSSDSKFSGTYSSEIVGDDYYIYVKDDHTNEERAYRYRSNDEGGSLCLLENDQCTTLYLPVS